MFVSRPGSEQHAVFFVFLAQCLAKPENIHLKQIGDAILPSLFSVKFAGSNLK